VDDDRGADVRCGRLDQVRRPRLNPALRAVWRDATSLQLGLSAAHGVVVAGVQEGDDALIEAMNGLHGVPALVALARSVGVAPERVGELVEVLERAGVLTDAARTPALSADQRADIARLTPEDRERLSGDLLAWSVVRPTVDALALLAARTRRHVRVDGSGRVADTAAQTLSAAGVGDVQRGEGSGAPSDVQVLIRPDAVDVCEADALVAADQPHLAVVTSGDRVVVGPLVLPGRSPCLRCLDLHRADRDPAWPHVVAQLVRRSRAVAPLETASATMAGALAALQVLAHLDGVAVPAAVGRTLEVTLPDGLVERRRWTPHPSCGCQRLPEALGESTAAAPAGGPSSSRPSGPPMHASER
jgi:bacteriocin biosynthesis cyclodehydratase domain-containing protein